MEVIPWRVDLGGFMAQWGENQLRLEARPHLQVSTSKEMEQWVWGMEPSALNPEFTTLVLGGHLRAQFSSKVTFGGIFLAHYFDFCS